MLGKPLKAGSDAATKVDFFSVSSADSFKRNVHDLLSDVRKTRSSGPNRFMIHVYVYLRSTAACVHT